MGRGDMRFGNLRSCASSDSRPARRRSHQGERKLAAFALMLLGGVLLWGAVTGLAKDRQPTTRTISGTVYDQAENIIPGATVELKDLQTGKVLDIYSQEDGQYLYTDLRFDHDYTVQAMFKGLASEVRHISILETRWTLVLNLTVPLPKK